MSVAIEEERGGGGLDQLPLCSFESHDVSLSLMGGPNSLGGQSRERGGNLAPYDLIRSKIPDLKGRAGYPGLGLHLSPFLATGRP